MLRAETRLGIAGEVPPEQRAKAYASTCRTMAYVMRASEPRTAARWYAGAPLAVRTNGFRQGIDRVGDETG